MTLFKILNKSRLWTKISIWDERTRNSRFWSKLIKITLLDKIAENVDYSQFFQKMSIWVKICKYNVSRFWWKSSNNFDYLQYLWKSRFWSKFMKISILVKIVGKFRFWSIIMEIPILFKIYENFRFCSIFMKISILVKIVG